MITAAMIAFNDEATIADAINSVRPHVDNIVVVISEHPINGPDIPPDRTEQICKDMGCCVKKTTLRKEADQRNVAISSQVADLYIIVEPDMVFDNLPLIISHARASNYSAFRCPQRAYWVDRMHIVKGDTFQPVVAIKKGVKFTVCQNVDHETDIINSTFVHHYNWCAPKDILKNVKTYHHAPQIASDWYEKNYLTWREGEPARFPDCTLEIERANI